MMGSFCAVLLGLLPPLAATEPLTSCAIDTFPAGTENRWSPAEGTPPLARDGSGDASSMELSAPFASRDALRRVVIDRPVGASHVGIETSRPLRRVIASADEFVLDVETANPAAFGHVTLYFRTGAGWFGASGAIHSEGRNEVLFRKSDFRPEDAPGAWDEVDRIRLAFWKAGPTDASLRLHTLQARQFPVAIVETGATDAVSQSAPSDARAMARWLASAGIPSASLRESDLEGLTPADRPLLIVPYETRWSERAIETIARYIENGGHVIAFYNLPPRVLSVLGFGGARYVKPEEGTLAEVRPHGEDLLGLPPMVRQASWNITAAEPVAHGARVAGMWFDKQGNATDLPALLVSDRGALFTHVLLAGDDANKKQFLASLCGHYLPRLWPEMTAEAARTWRLVGRRHPLCDPWSQIETIAATDLGSPRLRDLLDELTAAESEAADATRRGDYPAAIATYQRARLLLTEAYLLALPSHPLEARAWWNHSGTGVYAGDWDRTMRELSEAQFNMVVPNLLWAGVAHYPSELLPRSQTFHQYGDQIAQCVEAGKRHGVEVHVWKVNWNLLQAPREFVLAMRRENRTQVDVNGRPLDWLCPSHEANQELELNSMLEVVRRYDVDGLHFDYIRYPGSQSCFCDGCRERFEKHRGRAVANWPHDCASGALREAYNDWRCDNITRLVARVSSGARKVRPGVKISAAVFGSWPDCRSSIAQDWPTWVERGYLDFICPMNYTESDAAFHGLLENQKRLIRGRIPIYPGIGLSASNSTLSVDRVAGQIELTREAGVGGFTLFNLSESTAREILPGLRSGPTSARATLPHHEM